MVGNVTAHSIDVKIKPLDKAREAFCVLPTLPVKKANEKISLIQECIAASSVRIDRGLLDRVMLTGRYAARYFKEHYRVNGACVSGMDEAGGPVAHLYARDLPATADNKLYAYARVRERPPGSTALVMWLTALTAGFLWFYYLIWDWLVSSDTKGIDLASLSVALPGVASIWFSRAFREDVRTRVPLVSRFGLLFAVAALVTSAVMWLVVRRISFQREYQQLQVAAVDHYIS
jgi:hypothetical protein